MFDSNSVAKEKLGLLDPITLNMVCAGFMTSSAESQMTGHTDKCRAQSPINTISSSPGDDEGGLRRVWPAAGLRLSQAVTLTVTEERVRRLMSVVSVFAGQAAPDSLPLPQEGAAMATKDSLADPNS